MEKSNPYSERSDLEKIQSQWNKISGLHSRDEYSSAVVRAATAAEIAANFAVRREFADNTSFDAKVVDSFLRWANGISGKFEKLLLPINSGSEREKKLKELKGRVDKLNSERNAIVHRGEFRNEDESLNTIEDSRYIIEELLSLYGEEFKLEDRKAFVKSKEARSVHD